MNDTTVDHRFIQRILSVLAVIYVTAACDPMNVTPAELRQTPDSMTAENMSVAAPESDTTTTVEPYPIFRLPDQLASINLDNLNDISEIGQVIPYSPPYYHFAQNGSKVAIGDGQMIEVWDVRNKEKIASIAAPIPEYGFGFKRYFRLNADGSFIALVNGQSIQVWQIGGGLIYESLPYGEKNLQQPASGVDIPELALSPDGRLLAISGVAYSQASVKRYFRIIDIIANRVLYEWDGKNSSLHGNLYTFYGLGFSEDGTLLQTFDPVLFIQSEGSTYQAFRFWSVDGWDEVPAASQRVANSFQPGQLLYSRSAAGLVYVISKATGKITIKINSEGCDWDYPCETRFSDNGEYMLVLDQTGVPIRFKNDNLYPSVLAWDLLTNEKTGIETGQFRDLESILLQGDGTKVRADQFAIRDDQADYWWTFKENFSGLQMSSDGKMAFTPLMASSSQDCQFCATCLIDPLKGNADCSDGVMDSEGARISLKQESGQIFLVRKSGAESKIIGALALPDFEDFSRLRVRLLGYDMPQQTLFYCVDENYRQVGCFIYDPYMKKQIASLEDISFLRFSPDGKKAAYINRASKALFLYDLSSRSLTRKSPYQARAYPVNSVFSTDGSTLWYVIQSIDNARDLSMEMLDSQKAKATGRISLKKAGISAPTIFAASEDGAIWAFADGDGVISLLNAEKGLLMRSWQAHSDAIIGLAVAPENQWLLSMGEDGILTYWGIIQKKTAD